MRLISHAKLFRFSPLACLVALALTALACSVGDLTHTVSALATLTATRPVPIIVPTRTATPTKIISAVEATATFTPNPGETWQGTLHTETTGDYGAAGICTGEAWDMQFQVTVAGSGDVTGAGSGTLASNPKCSGPGFSSDYLSSQAKTVSFDVRGKRQDGKFDLQFVETNIDGETKGLVNYSLLLSVSGNPPTLSVPITGPSTAEGETTTSVVVPYSDGTKASGKHQVKMRCTSCS
jgi:hypothetical protein